MKKSRFTEEQIIGFLKQADAGMPIKELCRKGGFSDATFYKWRAKFGGMEASDAKRLKELEGKPPLVDAPLVKRFPFVPRCLSLDYKRGEWVGGHTELV